MRTFAILLLWLPAVDLLPLPLSGIQDDRQEDVFRRFAEALAVRRASDECENLSSESAFYPTGSGGRMLSVGRVNARNKQEPRN